jgi:DNA-binding protein HU-beta
MNRKELVAALAGKTGITRAEAEKNVLELIGIISDTLEKGGKINLKGFGIFDVRVRSARMGRNPKTGETLALNATRVPAFKPGGKLKASLNGVTKK